MANLICAIDPACQLFVAKVTDGRTGISPYRVARAITWAREQDVDIITMSFAMPEKCSELDSAIAKANTDKIVMLCSTHDEGSSGNNAFPAQYSETLAITACDQFGESLRPIKTDKYDYMFQGHEVPAGIVPFLESTDRVSGSSVATAIAAGLSSLIMSCFRLANQDLQLEKNSHVGRKEIVEKFLKRMRTGENKYVILDKFAGVGKKLREGDPIIADSIIKKCFSQSRDDTWGE